MEIFKDMTMSLKLLFEIEKDFLIMTRTLIRPGSGNTENATESRMNIPINSFSQEKLEQIFETFWADSSGANSQVYYSTSYIVNKDRMASMISNKSDTNYCLNIGSMSFDWAPDDNLYVYSDPRLSKFYPVECILTIFV